MMAGLWSFVFLQNGQAHCTQRVYIWMKWWLKLHLVVRVDNHLSKHPQFEQASFP
jgi:hypothetical protein